MRLRATLLILCLAASAHAQETKTPPTNDAPRVAPSTVKQFRVKLVKKPAIGQLDMAYVEPGPSDGFYHAGLPCVDPAESIAIKPAVAEFRQIKPCPKCLPGYICRATFNPPDGVGRINYIVEQVRTMPVTFVPAAQSLIVDPPTAQTGAARR